MSRTCGISGDFNQDGEGCLGSEQKKLGVFGNEPFGIPLETCRNASWRVIPSQPSLEFSDQATKSPAIPFTHEHSQPHVLKRRHRRGGVAKRACSLVFGLRRVPCCWKRRLPRPSANAQGSPLARKVHARVGVFPPRGNTRIADSPNGQNAQFTKWAKCALGILNGCTQFCTKQS